MENLESRIAGAEQTVEGVQLQNEVHQETIRSFFGVPFWTYYLATKVPERAIDLNRAVTLPYRRQDLFPASTLAATGKVPGYNVLSSGGDGIVLQPSSTSGEGRGLVLEYIVDGDIPTPMSTSPPTQKPPRFISPADPTGSYPPTLSLKPPQWTWSALWRKPLRSLKKAFRFQLSI